MEEESQAAHEFCMTPEELTHIQENVLRLKQEAMAELLGVSQPTISRMRRGRRFINPVLEKALAWELSKMGMDLAEELSRYRTEHQKEDE